MELWLILCGSVGGRGVWGRMDTRIRMAESLRCSCAISHIVNQLCAVLSLVAQSCLTLWEPMDCSPPASSVHRDSPGKNTGVSCHSLLQGIFSTQGLNLGLLYCRWILYRLSYKGSPINLEDMFLYESIPMQSAHAQWLWLESWIWNTGHITTWGVLAATTLLGGRAEKNSKWLSEEVLQTAEKRREAKGRGEKERYTHLSAEWEGNRQEGQGSPNRGNRLQVPHSFLLKFCVPWQNLVPPELNFSQTLK